MLAGVLQPDSGVGNRREPRTVSCHANLTGAWKAPPLTWLKKLDKYKHIKASPTPTETTGQPGLYPFTLPCHLDGQMGAGQRKQWSGSFWPPWFSCVKGKSYQNMIFKSREEETKLHQALDRGRWKSLNWLGWLWRAHTMEVKGESELWMLFHIAEIRGKTGNMEAVNWTSPDKGTRWLMVKL